MVKKKRKEMEMELELYMFWLDGWLYKDTPPFFKLEKSCELNL